MKPIRFGSLCSGVEAAHAAFVPLGWKPAWVAEIEPFPCAVLHHRCGAGRPERYPADGEGEKTWATNWKAICKNIPAEGNRLRNLGDMTTLPERIRAGEVEAPDVLVGGPPCFTAGHMVLADRGYIPIENVAVGDMVMTHAGRLREVVRVGSKVASVGRLRMVGNPHGIVSTPDHRYLSENGEWVAADTMGGRQWCSLLTKEEYKLESPSERWTPEEAAWLAGWYLGDGWVRRHTGRTKKEVVLGISQKKFEKLQARLGSRVTAHESGTCLRVSICDTRLAEWLIGEFGEGAHEKRIPAWWLQCPQGEELLDGYWCADGCQRKNAITSNSVSKSLALGIRDLAQQHGYVASFSRVEMPPTTTIQGRVVNQSSYWQVRSFPSEVSRKSRVRDGYLMRTAQDFSHLLDEQIVYDIEVDEDHSFVLDGAIVHNCQAFSFAGKRMGLEDARGNLTLTYIEVLDAIDATRSVRGLAPACAIYENVPGLLSDKTGAFGCLVAGLAGLDEPLEIEGGSRWPNAGEVVGPRRAVAWCILDAQYMAVAQRRKRIWLVATPVAEPAHAVRGIADAIRSGAGAVLALGTCEKRSTPTRRGTGQDAPAAAGGGAAGVSYSVQGNAIGRCDAAGPAGCGWCEEVGHTLTKTDVHAVGYAPSMLYLGMDGDVPDQTVSETRRGTGQDAPAAAGGGAAGVMQYYANHAQDFRVTGPHDVAETVAQKYGTGGGNVPLVTVIDRAAFNQGAVRCPSHWDSPNAPHPTLGQSFNTGGIGQSNQEVFSQRGCGLVAQPACTQAVVQGACNWDGDSVAPTPTKSNACGAQRMPDKENFNHVLIPQLGATRYIIRRLVPAETEILQGFPPEWSRIPWNGKPAEECPDGPRYKAMGNSWAVPCARWVGERLTLWLGGAL